MCARLDIWGLEQEGWKVGAQCEGEIDTTYEARTNMWNAVSWKVQR